MKLHSEYDYDCIRNSLSSYPVRLAINLRWPALKNKQRMCFELFEVFLTSSADQCFIFFNIFFGVNYLHLQIIEIISPTKHPISRLYLIIEPLHCPGGGGCNY